MRLAASLERSSKSIIYLIGFTLIGAIGLIDYLTGYELSFSVFYVLPIAFITWITTRSAGFAAALISAIVWLSADAATGREYTHPFIPIWNTIIRLAFFVIITWLLSELRTAMRREAEFARYDNLTGAVNSRFFYELAQMEIDRLERYQHPFTLAYLDLDNFKLVNDRFGHSVGDQALRAVVVYIVKHVRKADTVARLGGDEFAVLMPETGAESARTALTNLMNGLVEEMQANNWPITFSIGVLTCESAPGSTEILVKLADDLMYSVKRDSKNALVYYTFNEA